MILPYRTRSFLKRLGIWLAILAGIALVVWLCWLVWLNRFVLYTREGAKLEFSQSSQELSGVTAQKPVIEDPVSIYYNEGDATINTSKELTQLVGYYITREELEKNLPAVREMVKKLPKETPVMLDLKSPFGNFCYSSSVSANYNPNVDLEAMDAFLRELRDSGLYTIARMPALQDKLYGLEHVQDGLPMASGVLWEDVVTKTRNYWLNPVSDGTVSYLAQIANELRGLGFDEVVFYDYYVPEHKQIVFKHDRAEALAKTAQTLVHTCATDSFAVSFTSKTYFEPPQGRSRIFLQDIAATEAAAAAEQFAFEDPEIRVVFLTDVHDTRFDSYGVMRPIADAD